jgi:hypothetical protein
MKTAQKKGVKNTKKVSSVTKGRGTPKANKDEVCVARDVVQREQVCCYEIGCCCPA